MLLRHIFNIFLGAGIFGGVALGMLAFPALIFSALDDSMWPAAKPLILIWILCLVVGILGAVGLRMLAVYGG